MKKTLCSALALCFLSAAPAMAVSFARPVTSDVWFKSDFFAEKVMSALWNNVKPKRFVDARGGQILEINVANGIVCQLLSSAPNPRFPEPTSSFRCALLKTGRWNFLGNETYGTGTNAALSHVLFDALQGATEMRDANIMVRKIEVSRPNGRGGIERNVFGCSRPTLDGEKIGLRASCQFTNAL